MYGLVTAAVIYSISHTPKYILKPKRHSPTTFRMYIHIHHRSLAMAGYATQPLVGADSVKILIYQLALLYKR